MSGCLSGRWLVAGLVTLAMAIASFGLFSLFPHKLGVPVLASPLSSLDTASIAEISCCAAHDQACLLRLKSGQRIWDVLEVRQVLSRQRPFFLVRLALTHHHSPAQP